MHSLWFADLVLTVIWLFSLYLSLASAGRGSFVWFCIRMAFKSILVPKCCERLPAVEFYNRIWIRCLCSSIWRRNFLEGLCRFIAKYVVLLSRLHYVLCGSVLGFMYQNICIFTSWLLPGLMNHVKWFCGHNRRHFNCSCCAVWRYGVFMAFALNLEISSLMLGSATTAFKILNVLQLCCTLSLFLNLPSV